MPKFKIFYSWQSDLPGNKTRYFIRECIDEAIDLAQETEAIEAERDEATKDTTGSPDIVTTLLSKINDCDLFIADLSLCFTGDVKSEKRTPNPNVMFELGYAVKTLDWERVICLCNSDFGTDYPFDIAHNRITHYSLEGNRRKEVKSDIAKNIFKNIRDLRDGEPRTKAGVATHIVGTYCFEEKKVIRSLVPLGIGMSESYTLHNEELVEESKNLVSEILGITKRIQEMQEEDESLKEIVADGISTTKPEALDSLLAEYQSATPEVVHSIAESFRASEIPVVWKDAECDKERIKRWVNIEVSDDFFNLGELKQRAQIIGMHDPILVGTEDEKAKHEALQQLSCKLLLLDVRTDYLKTFEGMCFIPLAIQNLSTTQDSNIRVVVNVVEGEIIEPDEHLIWEEYEGMQGLLCRDDDEKGDIGVIAELFILPEDGVVHTEEIPYDPTRFTPKAPIFNGHGFSQPEKTEEDYQLELEEYIASTDGRGYYEFDVQNLRPGECRWLCCGMLLKPVYGAVTVHYQIHSAHSTGELSGDLKLG